MTETGGDIHVTDLEHDALVGSGAIGVVKPGREARIVADEVDVPPGAIGELLLRGPGMMSGYDDEPEATAHPSAAPARHAARAGWRSTG